MSVRRAADWSELHRETERERRPIRDWFAICAWRAAALLLAAAGLVGWGEVLKVARTHPALAEWGLRLHQPWSYACVGLILGLTLGHAAASLARRLHRPGQLGFTCALAALGVLLAAIIFGTNPAPLRLVQFLIEPAMGALLLLGVAGIWVLGLPVWPRRQPWQRNAHPPFLPQAPRLEAGALWLARFIPLACLCTLGLWLPRALPPWCWLAGLPLAAGVEYFTRQPEAPRNGPHLLVALEYMAWLSLNGLVIARIMFPNFLAAQPMYWLGAIALLELGMLLGAVLRQRLRRPARVAPAWNWVAIIFAFGAWLWNWWPVSAEVQQAIPGAPLLIALPQAARLALALLSLTLLVRLLLGIATAQWWWLALCCATGIAAPLGLEGMAFTWPLWLCLWLLGRQLVTGRLKWLSLAGGVAALSFAWSPLQSLWLSGALLVFSSVLVLWPVDLIATTLPAYKTRWFGLGALLIGWLPCAVAMGVALWLTHRGLPLARQMAALAQLQSGPPPWPDHTRPLMDLLPPLLLLGGGWAAADAWRSRRLVPLGGLIALTTILLGLAWASELCGDPLLLAPWMWVAGGLLIVLLLIWRAGPCAQLPIPLHGGLLRTALALALLIAIGVLYIHLAPATGAPWRSAAGSKLKTITAGTNFWHSRPCAQQAMRPAIPAATPTPAQTPLTRDPDEIPTYSRPALPPQ